MLFSVLNGKMQIITNKDTLKVFEVKHMSKDVRSFTLVKT